MPRCACGEGELYLLGFDLDPDLRTVMVSYRCSKCGRATRSKYAEQQERLREG